MQRDILETHRVADIFAQMNNKLGGDIEKIRTTGRYFVEIWKAIGMEGIGEKVPRAASIDNFLPACSRRPMTMHRANHTMPCFIIQIMTVQLPVLGALFERKRGDCKACAGVQRHHDGRHGELHTGMLTPAVSDSDYL